MSLILNWSVRNKLVCTKKHRVLTRRINSKHIECIIQLTTHKFKVTIHLRWFGINFEPYCSGGCEEFSLFSMILIVEDKHCIDGGFPLEFFGLFFFVSSVIIMANLDNYVTFPIDFFLSFFCQMIDWLID